jgi:hypothetical protein
MKNSSQEIAEMLLKLSELPALFEQLQVKKGRNPEMAQKILQIILAMSACNLVQTLKTDFLVSKLSPEKREAILRDYILQAFRSQTLVKFKNEAELNEKRQLVMGIVSELQKPWNENEDSHGSGPGPRYFCAKATLSMFGADPDFELHDALFEHMYLKYKLYIDFLKTL